MHKGGWGSGSEGPLNAVLKPWGSARQAVENVGREKGRPSRGMTGCVFQRECSWSAPGPEPGSQQVLSIWSGT